MNHNIFNSFSLVGNIAKVNEIKEQSNGTKFRYFTICQNTKYKDKNGETKDEPNFYDIKIFEKNFKNFENNLEVGKYINVFGKVKVYKDKNNKTVVSLIGSDSRALSNEKQEEIVDYDWLNENSEMEV
jgi:single-stranded DNA-binding protein